VDSVRAGKPFRHIAALYCVEWDVKLYYTVYHTYCMHHALITANRPTPCDPSYVELEPQTRMPWLQR